MTILTPFEELIDTQLKEKESIVKGLGICGFLLPSAEPTVN
jgi:hypothetical protein